MKIVATTLAVYLYYLTLLPCSDGSDWYVFHDHAQIGVALCEPSNEGHDHNESDCHDTCPPLCYCGCCKIMLDAPVDFVLSLLQPPLVTIDTAPTQSSQLLDVEVVEDIWQPPRQC